MEEQFKSDLDYIVGKYVATTSRTGKPNPRMADQIKLLVDANEIYLHAKVDIAEIKVELEERNDES